MALALALGALVAVAPMQTHVSASGDTLSIAMTNGSSFVYGGNPTPGFTITLVLPAPPTLNTAETASVSIDNGPLIGSQQVSESSDRLTFVFQATTDGISIVPGSHTASSQYYDPDSQQTVYSGSVGFQMAKGNALLNCSITNFASPVAVGQSLTFGMSFQDSPNYPVDWQNGTYTITFKGPTTISVANVAPDSNDTITIHAPTAIAEYGQPDCTFNGTSLYNSATATAVGQPILVSEEHALGSVQVFTNPTTLSGGQPADIYIVFHAAPGLPTPTGYVSLTFGYTYTNAIAIGSGGVIYAHLPPLPSLSGLTQFQIDYEADPYYNSATLNFPLTNPPIPGGVGGGNGGGGTGGSFGSPQATPSGTPHATATATRVATPTVTTASPNAIHTTTGSSGGTTTALWLAGALGVLVVLGGAGGFFVWSRRRRMALAAANAGPPFMSAPPPPGLSPYDDRTIADDATFPSREE